MRRHAVTVLAVAGLVAALGACDEGQGFEEPLPLSGTVGSSPIY